RHSIYSETLKAIGEAERRATRLNERQKEKIRELKNKLLQERNVQLKRFERSLELQKQQSEEIFLKQELKKKTLEKIKEYSENVRQNHMPSLPIDSLIVQDSIPPQNNLNKMLFINRSKDFKSIRYDSTFYHRGCAATFSQSSVVKQPSAIENANVLAVKQDALKNKKWNMKIESEKKEKKRFEAALEKCRIEKETGELLNGLDNLLHKDLIRKQKNPAIEYNDGQTLSAQNSEQKQAKLSEEFEKTFVYPAKHPDDPHARSNKPWKFQISKATNDANLNEDEKIINLKIPNRVKIDIDQEPKPLKPPVPSKQQSPFKQHKNDDEFQTKAKYLENMISTENFNEQNISDSISDDSHQIKPSLNELPEDHHSNNSNSNNSNNPNYENTPSFLSSISSISLASNPFITPSKGESNSSSIPSIPSSVLTGLSIPSSLFSPTSQISDISSLQSMVEDIKKLSFSDQDDIDKLDDIFKKINHK
ncbi:hypothetical protein ROZALSC1DRAFT_27873, partial [Rozella allomycis CSF55]